MKKFTGNSFFYIYTYLYYFRYLAIIVNPHAGVFDMDGEAKYNPSDSSGPYLIVFNSVFILLFMF